MPHSCLLNSEDKAQHAQLARNLALRTGLAVAVPNYRLTPRQPAPQTELRHPVHAEDVLAALHHLVTTDDPRILFNKQALFLIGHSCGAHILTSIFLDSSLSTPSLTPSPQLLEATKAVIASEGIYDLDLLIRNFPDYKAWFVANAFGELSSYSSVSTTTFPLRSNSSHVRWLIVHSRGDTLVDLVQSEVIYSHLLSCYAVHEGSARVSKDWETLSQDHHEALQSEAFLGIVAEFIKPLV